MGITEQAPSKVRPWLVWGSAGLFAMYQFLLQGSPSVILPELMSSFGIDTAQVGFLTTYFFYTYIVMQIPAGILVDIVGPKIILIIGCLSAATACVVFSHCHALWIAKGSRLFMGFMCAPGFVATLTLASRWFDQKKFALVVGFTETLAMIGAALGAIILAFTAHHFGWRPAILICGLVGYFVALLIFFIVRNYPPHFPGKVTSLKTLNLSYEMSNLWKVLKEPQAWIGGAYAGLTFALVPAFFALWGIPFFMSKFQIEAPMAAFITAFGYAGAGIGGPCVGWISDHIRRRKVVMNLGSFMAILVLIPILYLDVSRSLMCLLCFLLGFGISTYVIPFALVGEILPNDARGKAMGFTNCLTLLIGAPLLQPLMGGLLKSSQLPSKEKFLPALDLLFVSLVGAFLISFFIRETYCKPKID